MHILVGIDTGKTCGIACIDFNGRLVAHLHNRFVGIEWIISEIRKVGTPVVIAADKPVPSELIRKINAAFNARLYTPSTNSAQRTSAASRRASSMTYTSATRTSLS